MFNKCSEFLYLPIDTVEAFSMRKHLFSHILEYRQARHMKTEIALNYKYGIQEPVHEHRQELAEKFKNRVDYIDIHAYARGKVNVSHN